MFCDENAIPREEAHLINEEAFQYFEAELEERGKEMSALPRNRQFPTKLPKGWALIAVAYGVGRDDYLATILGFNIEVGKYATWRANYSVGPQRGDTVSVGEGHYFDVRDLKSNGELKHACERAWADFFARSTAMVCSSAEWRDLGAISFAQ